MKGGTGLLTAISISSVLSLVWMAVNPPNSPNLTKKRRREGTDEVKLWNDFVSCIRWDNIKRMAARYSLDSLNQPANREAPERDNYVFTLFNNVIETSCSTHTNTHKHIKFSDSCWVSVTHVLLIPVARLHNSGDEELVGCLYTQLWTINKG